MRKTRDNIGRSKGLWLGLAIFGLAVFLRGLYLYDSSDNPTFSAPIVDSLTYDQMARGLVAGRGLTHEFFWQPLFYPLFLSLVYLLTGSSVLWARVIQVVLGGMTSVLSWRLGAKLLGRPAGILAGVITAVYLPLVFFEGELLAVGWAAFCGVALVLAFLGAGEKPDVRRCFLLGLCGGLSIITRPVFLPFFAVAYLWLVVVWIRARTEVKKVLYGCAAATAGFLLVAAPAAMLSYRVMGKARILPYSGGVNFYIGNNPDYKETINIRPGLGWRRFLELPHKQGITGEYEKERFFSEKTVQYIVRQPGGFLKGLVYKTVQFFNSREMPRNVDIYLFRKWSGLLRVGVWKASGFGFPFGVLLPLAVVGAVLCRRMVPVTVWLFMVLYPTSVILVFVTSRYRMPIVPVMSVLAAAGCASVWRAAREGQWSRLSAVAVVLFVVGFTAKAAGPFYAEQADYEPEFYYALADSLDKHGRPVEAVEAYSKAVALRPDYVEAHHNLGLLFVKLQKLPEAIEHYQAALKADPENPAVYEDLGVALYRQGKTEDAIAQYRRAIEIDPNKASVHDNLGTALFRLNRLPEALESYSAAIKLDPKDPASQNNIGNIYAMLNQLDKALEHYEISLRIRPGDPETLNNLANVLAGLGRFPQAIDTYREALKISPNDPGIYYNMGLCLKQEGRFGEAADALRKTLELNPRHSNARKALKNLPLAPP
ncbi:MAG: tetratricopeptide repeat protein [Planctomycetota bacterium]|jgi:tetratricopeptide (TPR) repeat protein